MTGSRLTTLLATGRRAAVGKTTGPGRLKVWEVKTGTLKHDLAGHNHAEAASLFSGRALLASAGVGGDRDNGNGVLIWNAQTGRR